MLRNKLQTAVFSNTVINEISAAWLSILSKKFLIAFPAFSARNYRLYFFGQFISLIGTWLQIVAQGWLVFELTHSAFWVGFVAALGLLPVFFFVLFGGVIVDRYSKRRILYMANAASMVFSLLLGVMAITGNSSILYISILAFLLGIVQAIDAPARQSFIAELVGRKKLASAVALNSGMYNGARIIGPSIAGILLVLSGVGGAFLINSVSYLASILALFFMRIEHSKTEKVHKHPVEAIKEGIHYSVAHPMIRTLLVLAAITSIFGWSYTTLLPVLIQDTFHKGAASLGYFYSFAGLGAVLGAVIVSVYSEKYRKGYFILGGNLIFSVAIILFSLTTNEAIALPLLFLTGLGLVMQFSMINTTIQHLVPDGMRGRVMSIYAFMFMGLSPFGSFQIGALAEYFGSQFAIRIGGFIVIAFAVYLFTIRNKIREASQLHTSASHAITS